MLDHSYWLQGSVPKLGMAFFTKLQFTKRSTPLGRLGRRVLLGGLVGGGLVGWWALGLVAVADAHAQSRTFEVTINNVAKQGTLYTSGPARLGQGMWVIHNYRDPIFTEGRPARPNGLEVLSEEGYASQVVSALSRQAGIVEVGLFPVTALAPGEETRFSFVAVAGQRLSFAISLHYSNDKFLAPDGNGIALFDVNGLPVAGDVTSSVKLWDAGTEVDEPPFLGATQAPRQSRPGEGLDQSGFVTRATDGIGRAEDGFAYPKVESQIRVVIR